MLRKLFTLLGIKKLANYLRDWLTFPIIQSNERRNLIIQDGNCLRRKFRNLSIYEKAFYASTEESYAEFKDEIKHSMVFTDKYGLREYCVSRLKKNFTESNLQCQNLYIEFGVWRGLSINYFARELPNQIIYGFDSFQGIPEDWTGTGSPAGSFSSDGVLPKVEKNVELIIGSIEDELPEFLNNNINLRIAFAHIDVDIYSTAKFILMKIKEQLIPGSIILFDDFCCFPGWKNGEYKALNEVFDRSDYEFIGFGEMVSGITIK